MNETKPTAKPAVIAIAAALTLGAIGGYFLSAGDAIEWYTVLRVSGSIAIVSLLLYVLGSAERFPKAIPFVALTTLWMLAIFGAWTLLQ